MSGGDLGVRVRAPGRVNIIGDHTDHTGGLCLPMAIDRWVTIEGAPVERAEVRLTSADQCDPAVVPLDVTDVAVVRPEWARFVAGVVAELRPASGFTGVVRSTIPAGVGLSSSAALEVACALALGAEAGDTVALARRCQAAEHAARGVPTGLMDQLASIGGVAGHALLIDCHTTQLTPVPVPSPDEVEWVVIAAAPRSLATSAYTERTRELARAEDEIGPLRLADLGDVAGLVDPVVRARARHVVTENERVRAFAAALAGDDLVTAGALMDASHASLRDDYDSSTPLLDERWRRLVDTPGVLGARLTGGGWGGCLVAMCRPGSAAGDDDDAWTVRPVDGAGRGGPATVRAS